jgi:hypothetical protein
LPAAQHHSTSYPQAYSKPARHLLFYRAEL